MGIEAGRERIRTLESQRLLMRNTERYREKRGARERERETERVRKEREGEGVFENVGVNKPRFFLNLSDLSKTTNNEFFFVEINVSLGNIFFFLRNYFRKSLTAKNPRTIRFYFSSRSFVA